jgi:hypothetical protein
MKGKGVYMLHKKYTIKRVYFIFLEYIVYFFIGIMLCLFAGPHGPLTDIFDFKRITKVMFINDFLPFIAVILLFIPFWVVFRRSIFIRSDFIKVAESLNIKFIKKRLRYSLFAPYRFANGFLDNIYIVGGFDTPVIDVSPSTGHTSIYKLRELSGKDRLIALLGGGKKVPLEEQSIVELFSLIEGKTFNIDVKIRIGAGECEIPVTNCEEIDTVLTESLSKTDHFNARLVFNQQCLRMTIIGGSCEGGRFEQKIIKGFEIFQKINEALKKKYPVKSWKDWEVKWDKANEVFYLAQKVN